ncbi:tagaturonate reductase [Fodinibius salsisoli]|uniref:Tagaturonate reductase n=1 Tax=Fodinibius salsisoli TaxID=2820877 RepID=A0ABT3PKU5_9BACT|nr:tagaturonate reductase [Fodinibius salsisoli]MCW9706565.1 tagaturonate reductase [Fodinibius salsisoli]
MPKPLNRTTADVNAAPASDKVLQFGEGNFLRAFVDWQIDILNEKTSFEGNINIIQPIPHGMVDVLEKQDGLYHVLLEGMKDGSPHTEKRLITSVKGGINPYENYEEYLALGENLDLEFIVSNTTEAGISFDENDTSYEEIPSSFPAKLTALLHHRFNHFDGDPDTAPVIIPCELIDRNGDKLKEFILQYAELWSTGEDFYNWVDTHCTFCNTLVDRIVPGYPKERADDLKEEIGFDDNLIVAGEYFHLWVIEGPDSLEERLPFREAGLNVRFVDDLTPYRTRKVRILNGLHTSMVPVGYLHGNRTVKDAVDDEIVGPFLQEELYQEIIPTLDFPEDELREFADDILERFYNPYIKHELSAIALNSISKYKVRVLPSLLKYHEIKGELPHRLTFALAALLCFYKGEWNGEPIPLNDSEAIIASIKEAWSAESVEETVQKILSTTSFWDQNLDDIPGLTAKTANYVSGILENGVASTIQEIDG